MKKTRSHFHLSMETTSNGFFNEDSMVNSFGSTIFTGFTKSFSHMHSFPFSFNTSSSLHPFSFGGALLNRLYSQHRSSQIVSYICLRFLQIITIKKKIVLNFPHHSLKHDSSQWPPSC